MEILQLINNNYSSPSESLLVKVQNSEYDTVDGSYKPSDLTEEQLSQIKEHNTYFVNIKDNVKVLMELGFVFGGSFNQLKTAYIDVFVFLYSVIHRCVHTWSYCFVFLRFGSTSKYGVLVFWIFGIWEYIKI